MDTRAAIASGLKDERSRETGAEPAGFVGVGALGRELVALAFPILGSIVLELIEGSLNAMWVGRYLGPAALTAVSNANTVFVVLLAGAFGVWMALTIRVGHHFGAGRIEDVRGFARAAGWLFLGGGSVVAVVLEIFAQSLLRGLEVPAESLRQAEQYLRVILLSVPITYLYGTIFAVLRGAGETRSAFLFPLLAAVLDAGLNPLFIFGLGPLPRGGVSGSAWATVLAQVSSLGALLLFLYWRRHPLCLQKGEFAMQSSDWPALEQLFKQGAPMGLEYLWYSLLAILMISLVNRFGTEVTAAYGAMIQLWSFLMMPSTAVGLAATSMAARSLGAGRWDQVKVITRLSVGCSVLTSGLLLLLVEGLDRGAFMLFLPPRSPALLTASQINHEASWFCVLLAGGNALMGTPRAAGAVWAPLALSILTIGSRFPIAEVLRHYWAAQGIWWSFSVSGVITAIATTIYYQRGKWRRAAAP